MQHRGRSCYPERRPRLTTPTALVANLPYNIAVPVVLHLLAVLPSLRHGLVMVQQEVADRQGCGAAQLTAVPPQRSGLCRAGFPA
jgi:16S rRNA A1518/A1519 N6-dimethyltransferase RsmA/KsgA/DIM1 with predicted DNA glycosylase/AP lyase activity